MRVLMTTDALGGVWTYSIELASALQELGVEVSLAAMGGRQSPDRRRQAREVSTRLFARDYALEWMREPWVDVDRAGEWLLDVAAQLEPDVVHLNGYAHAALPWRAPVVVVGHSCVLSWFEAVRRHPAPAEWERYARTVRRGIGAADLLVAPTRAFLDELVRLYEPTCPRLAIPNGRDPARFAPGPKEPLVLAAGRLWDEAKNIHALDRVAPRLPWPVAVAGDWRHPDGPSWRARSLRPLGPLPEQELAGWLGRAAIYALPACYEPFGLGPLEAALAGCALVLGDIATLREVWGDAALYVDPADDRELERALLALIANEKLRRSLAEAASARALEYAPERAAAAYAEAYRSVRAQAEAAA